MKILVTRKLLAAIGMMVCTAAYASGNDLRYSELEQRLAVLESQVASQQGVQSASYLSDSDGAAAPAASASCGCENSSSCCDCATSGCCCPSSCGCNDCCGTTYGYYEMLWIRPHVNEDFAGKLSEEHNFSSRYVLGYEDACGIGARVRYWNYDHAQDVLTDGDTIRFEDGRVRRGSYESLLLPSGPMSCWRAVCAWRTWISATMTATMPTSTPWA